MLKFITTDQGKRNRNMNESYQKLYIAYLIVVYYMCALYNCSFHIYVVYILTFDVS